MTENEAKRVSVRELATRTIKELKEEVAYFKENISLLLKEIERLKGQVQEFETIGTIEEFKDLKEYKEKMEMQYLDDINNPLEPLRLSSALQSEIRKYEYRKEYKPQDISPLDYTIMYALKHCLGET